MSDVGTKDATEKTRGRVRPIERFRESMRGSFVRGILGRGPARVTSRPRSSMKIAMYDDRHFSLYGAQRVMISLAVVLQRKGFHPVVVTGAHGPLADLAESADVPVCIVPIPAALDIYSGEALRAPPRRKIALARRAFRYSKRLHHVFEDLDVDIIFANALRPLLYCAVTAGRSSRPVIWFVQGARSFGIISVIAASLPDRVMMVSRGAEEVLPRPMRPFLRSKIFVNPPGIDQQRYLAPSTDRETTRAQLGLSPDAFVIVAVGSVEYRKGFDILLEALAIARTRAENLELVIAGSARGDIAQVYERKLVTFAERRELRVSFAGWVEDVPALMAASNLFVLSSRQERFGLVTIEAMASGLPVIVTRAGGSEETIVHEQTGLLVEPEDVSGLADAIIRIALDDELRQGLAREGRRRVLEHYTLDQFVDRFVRDMRSFR